MAFLWAKLRGKKAEAPSPVLSPENIQSVVKGDQIHRIRLRNGESYVFKPNSPGNEDRDAYIAKAEFELYNKFACLQGNVLPICYGIETMDGKTGLVLEDCGSKTFEDPPADETSKFILYLRANCIMERCLAAGLLHEDIDFRNVVFDPETLKVRFIDIEPWGSTDRTAKEVWRYLDAGFPHFFDYTAAIDTARWRAKNIFKLLIARPLDLAMIGLVFRYWFA